MMNQRNVLQKMMTGLLLMLLWALTAPVLAQENEIAITAKQNLALQSKPDYDSDVLGVFPRGAEATAFGRDEAGTWLQIERGWVNTNYVKTDGNIMDLPVISGESTDQSIMKTSARDGITIIVSNIAVTVRTGPSVSFGRVGRLQRGAEAVAIGRNKNGTYLQIEDGWILASSIKADGDVMALPITGQSGITITPKYSLNILVLSRPTSVRTSDVVGSLQNGEEALAFGRNEAGTRLQVSQGWVDTNYVEADDDIMDLPVTSSTVARTTPAGAFSEQTIRSLVIRYTDDIRILKISQRASATSIEYDLKSWFLVPNESIAKEVVFKMICALRRGRQIPHKLEFIGQGNFKSDVGRKFRSPSVEIHISASNANRIVCSGNNYTDINWRSLSSFYKSYPVPRGATVDD